MNKKYYILAIAGFLYGISGTLVVAQPIERIHFNMSLLESDCIFTDKTLPKFLAEAYNEKKFKNEDFNSETCLNATKMGTEGSFNTLQLFLVTSTCRPGKKSMYIIKEAREGLKEATSLQEIAAIPGMKELLAPNTPPKGLPNIALPLAYFSYGLENSGNQYGQPPIHYIAAMPAAKGKALCEVVTAYRDNKSVQNADQIKRAYKILGNELANFHKRFKIAHGDFHCFNVFFDGMHCTFIDNETMAEHKKDLSDDIVKPFLAFFSTTESDARKNIIKGIDLKVWHDLAFKNYIEGYLDAYKPDEQKKVFQDLKKMFNSNNTFPWLKISAAELQKIRTTYINPVFAEIEKKRFA